MTLLKVAAKVSRLPSCLPQPGDQKASGGLSPPSTALRWSHSDWPSLSPGKLARPLSVGTGSRPGGFTPVLALIFQYLPCQSPPHRESQSPEESGAGGSEVLASPTRSHGVQGGGGGADTHLSTESCCQLISASAHLYRAFPEFF